MTIKYTTNSKGDTKRIERIPNAETLEAIEELKRGEGTVVTIEELVKLWNEAREESSNFKQTREHIINQ